MTMTRNDTPRVLLCALRAFGGAAFLAPGAGARQLEVGDSAEAKYLVRLFAARNVALTAGLLASRGGARRLWWQAGIACDALDVAAGVLGYRAGKQPKAAVVDTSASAFATLLGTAGLLLDGR
jgi:hypothetical protein